jgi:hypothetical protein
VQFGTVSGLACIRIWRVRSYFRSDALTSGLSDDRKIFATVFSRSAVGVHRVCALWKSIFAQDRKIVSRLTSTITCCADMRVQPADRALRPLRSRAGAST